MSDLISRAEAIKAVRFYEEFCDPYPRVIESLESLPSVQPEFSNNSKELENNSKELENENGELISRQRAIEALDSLHYNDREDWCFVLDTVEHLPSVQPDKDLIHLQKEQAYMQGYEDGQKSRNGKWIYEGDFTWKCSECDDSFILLGGGTPNDKGCNFCWHCGADMRGDSDE